MSQKYNLYLDILHMSQCAQCAQCESDDIHNFHQWGFRVKLWTLFGDKDIDLLCKTSKECNSALWYSFAVNYKLYSDIHPIVSQKKTGKVSLISYNSNHNFPSSREYPDQVYDLSCAYITCNCDACLSNLCLLPFESFKSLFHWWRCISSYTSTSSMSLGIT